jgi:hypothetical protein
MRRKNKTKGMPNGDAPKPRLTSTAAQSIIEPSFLKRIQITDSNNLRSALSGDYLNQIALTLTILSSMPSSNETIRRELGSILISHLKGFKTYKQYLLERVKEHKQHCAQDIDESQVLAELFYNNPTAQKLEMLAIKVPSTISMDGSIDLLMLRDLVKQMIMIFEEAGVPPNAMEALEKAFAPHSS